MALSLLHRAAAAYRSHIKHTISVRSYITGYGSDDDEDGKTNGKNGNGKSSNGHINNGNNRPLTLRKHRTPSEIIADFEKGIRDGEGDFNKQTTKTSVSSSKGFIDNIKDKYLPAAIATGVAVFSQLFTHTAKQAIKEKFEIRLRALELNRKNDSEANMTPNLRIIGISNDEILFQIPMPGMDWDHCTCCWDVHGLMLNIRGDNGDLEFQYTTPEVPKRFKHGLVTLKSLDVGFLIVSVKVKTVAMGSRSYRNSPLNRELGNSSEQRSDWEVNEMVASFLTALSLDKVVLDPGNDVSSYIKTWSILDIGTGDGLLLQKLARMGFSHLTGTDSSDEAVKVAQQLAKCNGFPSIKFLVDDILKTNLKGHFCLINDKQTLDEIGQLQDGPVKRITYWETVSRLVAPGGLVVITSFCHTREQLVQEVEKFNQLKARTHQETKTPGETKSYNNSRIFSYVDHTYPAFKSGGSVGSRVATVAFMRS